MVSYVYSCGGCGRFELRAPIGTAAARPPCPNCDAPSRRVFTPPRVGRGPADPLMKLIEATKRSACDPQVVDSIPKTGKRQRRPTTRDPRHATLPRP